MKKLILPVFLCFGFQVHAGLFGRDSLAKLQPMNFECHHYKDIGVGPAAFHQIVGGVYTGAKVKVVPSGWADKPGSVEFSKNGVATLVQTDCRKIGINGTSQGTHCFGSRDSLRFFYHERADYFRKPGPVGFVYSPTIGFGTAVMCKPL